MGASIVGRPCSRHLWYVFRWASEIKIEGRILKLLERGQREEDWMADVINSIEGITLHVRDPLTQKQYRVSAHGGHFGGSLDGIAIGFPEAPKSWHLWECKTAADKYNKQLDKKGCEAVKFEHVVQQNIYMYLGQFVIDGKKIRLRRSMYHSVNKNNDHIYQERVSYDKAVAVSHLEKAGLIIFANEPLSKISEDPSWYQCSFCDHKPICHFDAVDELDRNCRTCLSSTPTRDGKWICEHFHKELEEADQKAGCDSHLFIPALLPKWEVMEVDETKRRIVYKRDDGILITDMQSELCVRPIEV